MVQLLKTCSLNMEEKKKVKGPNIHACTLG